VLFVPFFKFVIIVIHFEFIDVYDYEGITHLCATLSGFWWIIELLQGNGTVVADLFGTVVG
jgi:hypothetical protein